MDYQESLSRLKGWRLKVIHSDYELNDNEGFNNLADIWFDLKREAVSYGKELIEGNAIKVEIYNGGWLKKELTK